MSSVIIELRNEALDGKVKVTDLLRKALVVSKKLHLEEFQKWINQELGGYGDSEDAPEYRKISGQVKAWNPYNGSWIPINFEDPKKESLFSQRHCGQSIAEVEDLIRGEGYSDFHMSFSGEARRMLCESVGFETNVSLFTSRQSLVRIVDTVRTIILNWTLKLEEEGVLGEGLSFTAQEKEVAKKSPQNVVNFYGPVHAPQIQQGSPKSIQISTANTINVDGVKAFAIKLDNALESLDLSKDQQSEVKAETLTVKAQAESPKPKNSIIRESLSSIRRILEGAGGGVAGNLLIELGKLLG